VRRKTLISAALRLAAFLSVIGPATAAEPTTTAIDSAIRRGVDFLVGYQNPNGSWGGPTRTKGLNIYAPLPGAHHAFRAGASGLALSGLIDSGDDRPEVAAAIDKAGAWTAETLPKLRRADQTTTYNIWGHAYGLRALTRLHQRETDPAKKQEWTASRSNKSISPTATRTSTAAGDTSMFSMTSPPRNPPACPLRSPPPPCCSPWPRPAIWA
jgi:hypothetical protein